MSTIYLGFITIKPTPYTVIGQTILKPYPSNEERQNFGLRNYQINLFGCSLTLSSLAFMEQDKIVSACATTAIWSMLQKANVSHNSNLISPSQITAKAGSISQDGNRIFPNKGLTLLQISQIIHKSNLVCEIKSPDTIFGTLKCISNEYLKQIIYAYSKMGLPMILIIYVPTEADTYGIHAITISGYNISNIHMTIPSTPNTSYTANRINKLYAHDDQIGPFARIGFLNEKTLKTDWNDEKKDRHTFLLNIIVPLYYKIRISYEDISSIIKAIDTILYHGFKGIEKDIIWDIYLDFSENYKRDLRTYGTSDAILNKLLYNCYPKYIWRAKCKINEDETIFEFIFDATDLSTNMFAFEYLSFKGKSFTLDFISYIELNKKEFLNAGYFVHPQARGYLDFLTTGTIVI
ncbi:MAG: hypothetical protein K9I85_12435 [Saprospiraceae bacterium]|nr:hypothetical protein [Saprospiraceae bacterium]